VAIVATGGGATPFVAGLLAGVAGGTAAVAAGAKVRWQSTSYSVLRDFGTGFVEGVASVAGSALAARVVHGAAAGVAAGRAAVAAGGQAVTKATSGIGAVIAEGMIDGAVGGAAGELFQTATDESTWDHGIAMAFAAMLAAVARGAAMGGVAGGAIGGAIAGLGKLAARVGDDAARGVGRMLDSSGVGAKLLDDLVDNPDAQDGLAKVYRLLEAGHLDQAEAIIRAIPGIRKNIREMLLEEARTQAALASYGDFAMVEFGARRINYVDDKEFRRLAAGRRGDAVVVIEGGQPRIVARKKAPPSAIREEIVHLHQWQTDVTMRARMMRLSEETFADANWRALSSTEKLNLHLDKLEVEADAQRRIIDQFEHLIDADPDAAVRVMDAEETLFNLTQRIQTLHGARGKWLDLVALKIDKPPRLFAAGAQTRRVIRGRRRTAALKLIGKPVKDNIDELKALGYRVHRHEGAKVVFRITRDPEMYERLPHLTIIGGQIEKGIPLASFEERQAAAALEWTRTAEDLERIERELAKTGKGALVGEARQERLLRKKAAGPEFRKLLAKRIATGTMDEASAGLLAKWGRVLEDLESRFPGQIRMEDFLATLPKRALVESEVDDFRRLIRRRIVDELMEIDEPAERTKKLYELIKMQPDNASMGHLFTEYRNRAMGDVADLQVTGTKPMFTRKDVTRYADDVLYVKGAVYKNLPQGRFAVEDKTGKEAFKIVQAELYAKARDPKLNVFKPTPNSTESFDGIVYVFSRGSEAEKALYQLKMDKLTKNLLGVESGGIHVMYLDADGELKMMTELATKSIK
jgi:hypothetical protein